MSNDIEAILKATIQTKVIEAFNKTPEMIDKLVEAAMSKEVNQYGVKPSGYDDKKMPYMEWLVGEEIRKAIAESMREYVNNNKDVIRDRVAESIKNAEFGNTLADAVANIMSEEWRWSVSLDVKKD